MIYFLSNLMGSTLNSIEGPLGTLVDAYFDDRNWELVYAVCQLNHSLDSREKLIPWSQIHDKDWDLPLLRTDLKYSDLATCPNREERKPVSKQMEGQLETYFTWPELHALGSLGVVVVPTEPILNSDNDPHLRSFMHVLRYNIVQGTQKIGKTKEMIVTPTPWKIQRIVYESTVEPQKRQKVLETQEVSTIDFSQKAMLLNFDKNNSSSTSRLDLAQFVFFENELVRCRETFT